MRKLAFFLTVFTVLAAPPPAWADLPADLEKSLCGDRPQDPGQAPNLNRLLTEMPPVRIQNPAEWCSAFAANTLLSHYLYTQRKDPQLSPEAFYEIPENRPSVLDGMSHVPDGRTQLDLNEGTLATTYLFGVQKSGVLRSEAQVPWDTLYEDDEESWRRVVDTARRFAEAHPVRPNQPTEQNSVKLGRRTIEVTTCVTQASLTEFKPFLQLVDSFDAIHNELLTNARMQDLLKPQAGEAPIARTQISTADYRELAERLHGKADLVISPPFDILERRIKIYPTQSRQTVDPTAANTYLATLRQQVVTQKTPVSLTVCSEVFDRKPSPGTCSGHAVVAIDAGWEPGGGCQITVMNSQSREGIAKIPVSKLITHISSGGKLGAPLTWIQKSVRGGEKGNYYLKSDGSDRFRKVSPTFELEDGATSSSYKVLTDPN